jgi:hypothetical protein
VRSISSALADSSCLSIAGPPLGDSIEPISSSDKPATWPRAISASRSSTSGAKRRRIPARPVDAIKPFFS